MSSLSPASPPSHKNNTKPLPPGWKWVKLGDVTNVVNGTTPASENKLYWNGDIVWITPTDLGKLDLPEITNSERRITSAGFKHSNLTLVPPGTVVLSSRAPIGYLGIATIELCTNQGCKSFIPGSEIDTYYLYFTLKKSVPKLKEIGRGPTFNEISKSQCERFDIPMPLLSEQKRIAAILKEQLTAIDKARKAAEERLAAVKALPAAFLRKVFPKPGQPLPDGWKWVKLGEVCEVNPRKSTLERDDNVLTSFVPMEAVDATTGIITAPQIKSYKNVKKGYTFFIEKDVLFAKITPCMQNGKHSIAHNLIDGIGFGTTEFHVLRPKEVILSEIIWYFLRQPNLLIKATEHFTGAVGQQRLPQDYLKTLDLPLPPLVEQKRFASKLIEQMAAVEKARIAAEEELKTINALPAAILRKAFNGEI